MKSVENICITESVERNFCWKGVVVITYEKTMRVVEEKKMRGEKKDTR